MADYKLRYYKDYGLHDSIVRLEILKKHFGFDPYPDPIEIGCVLSGARLVMQGDQEDISAPIVKTSLELSLVDAPDTEYGRMTGPWEEFYTPDATDYLVRVLVDGVVQWSGFITPDSFEEDITEFGVVTIIARDNIGHLQDFIFEERGNADGMISVADLLSKAWQLIESPMVLSFQENGDVVWPECYGYRPYEMMLNVEAFADKNWYDVIDSVLDSFGLALRWVGNNKCVVCPLRALHLQGMQSYDDVTVSNTMFQASGHRTLMRTLKKVKDSGKYDIDNAPKMQNVIKDDFTGEQLTYRCKITGENFGIMEHDAPVWPIRQIDDSQAGWRNTDISKTLFFDVSRYDFNYFLKYYFNEDSIKSDKVMYIAANNVDNRVVEFHKRVYCRNFTYFMQFDMPLGLTNTNELAAHDSLRLGKIIYRIYAVGNSIGKKYWTRSSWVNAETDLVNNYDINSDVKTFEAYVNFNGLDESVVDITLEIVKIEYNSIGAFSVVDKGVYARLQAFLLKVPDDIAIAEDMTVTSVYDENANYLLTRESAFLANNTTFFLPKVIKNGIYLPEPGYPSATPWHWPNDSDTTELQVLIAQQLALFNGKPNNLLTGTVVSENEILSMQTIWRYNGRSHILISGSLDLLSGYIEDAKLREFEVWGGSDADLRYLVSESDIYIVTEDNRYIIA